MPAYLSGGEADAEGRRRTANVAKMNGSPRPNESVRGILGETSGPVLPQQATRDDRLLDLRGALADEEEGRLPHQALDLVLLGVAVAAVDPERLLDDLGAILRREELGHPGLDVVALPGVLEPGGAHHEGVRRLDLRTHLGQLEGDRLVLVERPAERLPLLGVRDRELERA